jgi:hypothetical protein
MMFRTWWKDGSRQEYFCEDEVSDYAERFSFSVSDLLHFREVEFRDEDNCLVGGVVEVV